MNNEQWAQYVQRNKEKGKERSQFLSLIVPKTIPISIVVGIFASIVVIEFWGFKEYSRMMLQLVLGLTLATTVLATTIKRLESKFGKQ